MSTLSSDQIASAVAKFGIRDEEDYAGCAETNQDIRNIHEMFRFGIPNQMNQALRLDSIRDRLRKKLLAKKNMAPK